MCLTQANKQVLLIDVLSLIEEGKKMCRVGEFKLQSADFAKVCFLFISWRCSVVVKGSGRSSRDGNFSMKNLPFRAT